MVSEIDEYRLMAYADGELDAANSREVERALAADPGLAQRVTELRGDAMLLKSSYQHLLAGAQVPGWLLHKDDPAATRPLRPTVWRWRRSVVLPWAIAASLASLLVGTGVGQMMGRAGVESAYARAGLMTPGDLSSSDATLKASLESDTSGTSRSWKNPDNGHFGEIMPVRTFKSSQGQYCREFVETATVSGTSTEAGGIACRQPGVGWKVRLRYYSG